MKIYFSVLFHCETNEAKIFFVLVEKFSFIVDCDCDYVSCEIRMK